MQDKLEKAGPAQVLQRTYVLLVSKRLQVRGSGCLKGSLVFLFGFSLGAVARPSRRVSSTSRIAPAERGRRTWGHWRELVETMQELMGLGFQKLRGVADLH